MILRVFPSMQMQRIKKKQTDFINRKYTHEKDDEVDCKFESRSCTLNRKARLQQSQALRADPC